MLREIGVSEIDGLLEFHLAPLAARRDMAMLGLIHRSVLGLGPSYFGRHFVRMDAPIHPTGRNTANRHNMQLNTFRTGKFLEMLGQSVFGGKKCLLGVGEEVRGQGG